MKCFLTVLLLAITCPSSGQDLTWTATDGLPQDQPGWSILTAHDAGVQSMTAVASFGGGILPAMWLEDDVPWETDVGIAHAAPFASDVQDAVYEFVARHADGLWKIGLSDGQKEMALTFLWTGNIGFSRLTSPSGGWGMTHEVHLEPFSTDELHTYRVEKHGQDFVRVFVDGTQVMQVPYSELPGPGEFSNNPGVINEQLANLSVLARGGIGLPGGNGGIWLHSYRHHIGATYFAEEAPPCPADLDGDGVVAVPDLLALLAAWGPCP